MQHLIATYGLLAVGVLMMAESACIPVPSEATMLLAGALAAGAVSGPHPSLAAVIVAGTFGNVAGSYLAWLMGRAVGRPGLRRWGRYVGVRPQEIDKAQGWFDRRGASVVFWSRLLPGIRTFVSLPAGIAQMPAARFGLYTAAGCLPWTAVLAIVGYGLGADWPTTERVMHRHSVAIAVVVIIAIGVWVLGAIRRSRRSNAGEVVGSVHIPTDLTVRNQLGDRPGVGTVRDAMDGASCEFTGVIVTAAPMPIEDLSLTRCCATPVRPPAQPASTATDHRHFRRCQAKMP